MIRILIFLLSIVFLAGAITYFSSLDSRITGEAFGYKFDGHSGLIVGMVFFGLLAAIYLTHKIKDIMALPAKIRARDEQTHRVRGIAALTRGLEAVAVGDASAAAHHAKVARRHLDDMALTRLLSAQAAQLSGDEAAAKASFSAMLDAPETEFMGLKGLYLQAMAKDDRATARGFAERAFRLRPNARWAFDSIVELGLERGAWGETRGAIEKARRNGLINVHDADRAAAALLTADAYAASASDEAKTALSEAEAALKLASSFTPAAMLAARLYADDGKTGKAAKIIEAAFAAEPHPALIRLFDKLYTNEIPEKRASRLRKLAERNPESAEATLLQARAFNLLGEWAGAIGVLEPLLTQSPTAPAFALMATAAAGLNGDEAARVWLEHAAAAPRDPRPGADGEFHLTREGWARMVRDYMATGRLAPPPLEAAAAGVSVEEIRLLTAPPIPDIEIGAEEAEGEAQSDASVEVVSSPIGEAPVNPPSDTSSEDHENHIRNDEDAEQAAAAAREVS
jgi:HemY protein